MNSGRTAVFTIISLNMDDAELRERISPGRRIRARLDCVQSVLDSR